MGYRARDELGFGILHGRAYFLDLRKDRYFCLPPRTNQAFCSAVDGDNAGDSSSLALLIDQGFLLEHIGETALSAASIDALERSFVDDDEGARASVTSVARALAHQAVTAAALRYRPLGSIVAGLRRRMTDSASGPTSPAMLEILRGFRASAIVLSPNDRCLLKSIALTRALRRAGMSASLVFGVRDAPFFAHCWVQAGRTVLNDELDHARSYHPVLVA